MSTIKTNQVLNLDGDRIGSVVVDSIANLKNLNTEIEANATVELLGYYSKGDGGGGTFYWDSTSIEDDNGGTIIEATGVVDGRWIRNYSGAVNVKLFGAVGDGVTDDTTSIQNAALTGLKLLFKNGTFLVDSGFVEITQGVEFDNSAIVFTGVGDGSVNDGWVYFDNPTKSILPEWFGAVGDGVTNDATAIQMALDCLIDTRIDALGVTANPNHGIYNSGTIEFSGGKDYYRGDTTIEIRSEHHFIGVRLINSSPSKYTSNIRGNDATTVCFKVTTPDNIAGDGASTNKEFINLGIINASRGIEFGRSDQSNKVIGCRFQVMSEACVYGTSDGVDNLQIKDNTINDSGGGYVAKLKNASLCIIDGNLSGESAQNTKGVYVVGGTSRSGNIISNNTFRGGEIYVTTNSAFTDHGNIVSNNAIIQGVATTGDAVINIDSTSRTTVVEGNVVDTTEVIKCISFFDGLVSGNRTSGGTHGIFSAGLGNIQGNKIVSATSFGIEVNRGAAQCECVISNNNIEDCATGVRIQADSTGGTMVTSNTIDGCAVGLTGGSGYQRGFTTDNRFFNCTTNETTYKPTPNRQHDRTLFIDTFSSSDAESIKVRSGTNRNAVVVGTYSSIPITGTWKAGDIVFNTSPVAGGKVGWVCTASGTSGTWKAFGIIDA